LAIPGIKTIIVCISGYNFFNLFNSIEETELFYHVSQLKVHLNMKKRFINKNKTIFNKNKTCKHDASKCRARKYLQVFNL